ncbi:MAG: 16S rRNA (guanine(527)-N(7))-methyltransferase RsmG [Firmicutes bacterium]|nr:16S rRNA (guanine(527)-N(7))-methyltransferase RsmG [Bacillota bacterium]
MEHLIQTLRQFDIEPTERQLAQFEGYRAAILEWNEKVNLTAIKDPDEFERKHFSDSVAIAGSAALQGAKRIIDVGTGGGFPGVPLAILFPEKEFVLMDSLAKRLVIVDAICKKLEINNVTVVHARAEDLGRNPAHRERYDLCVSRAVANLRTLAEYCLPLVRVGGSFAAYKAETAREEAGEARKALAILGGKLASAEEAPVPDGEAHLILWIRKESATPKKYPRKAGMPTKNPL